MAAKKIGLFFGSFNPVHNGHLMIANYMAEFGDLDQLWFVISPLNPFKADKDLLADYHRRELLTRAIGDYNKFRVSSVEFSLPKPSYTIDTLIFLKNEYPGDQFILIMGSDQLPGLSRWKKYDQILAEYKILVYPRPGEGPELMQPAPVELLNHPGISLVDAPMIQISSTFIRQSIRARKDVRFFMPDQAWHYLDEMNFYR
jgi:nicotinate-nucleotide adenylyltransferase